MNSDGIHVRENTANRPQKKGSDGRSKPEEYTEVQFLHKCEKYGNLQNAASLQHSDCPVGSHRLCGLGFVETPLGTSPSKGRPTDKPKPLRPPHPKDPPTEFAPAADPQRLPSQTPRPERGQTVRTRPALPPRHSRTGSHSVGGLRARPGTGSARFGTTGLPPPPAQRTRNRQRCAAATRRGWGTRRRRRRDPHRPRTRDPTPGELLQIRSLRGMPTRRNPRPGSPTPGGQQPRANPRPSIGRMSPRPSRQSDPPIPHPSFQLTFPLIFVKYKNSINFHTDMFWGALGFWPGAKGCATQGSLFSRRSSR